MKYISLFISCIILASCVRSYRHEEALPSSIPVTLSESSPSFSQKNLELSIDSIGNVLLITLSCHLPANAPFPVNAAFKDTLTETAFLMEIKADGNPIYSDYDGSQDHDRTYNSLGRMRAQGAPLLFKTDTFDLRSGSASIELPYYAFHRLKQGAHNIELSISQHMMRSNHASEVACYDSVFHHPSTRELLNHAEKPMACAKAHFKINVPALHKTILYMNRIDLKNDSAYSPYGSDNTIWNSSLPDIYWTVAYPGNNYYSASHFEKSTMSYTTPDTVSLYHYSTTDTVRFAVYDHDNLSRDDGLGYAYFSLRDMIKRKRLNASFWYVKLFSLKVDYKGVVNH